MNIINADHMFQKMVQLQKILTDEETHKDSNCLFLTVISHGDEKGQLKAADRRDGWKTEELVWQLDEVDSLQGKPKILIINACRGSKNYHFI